MERCSLSTGCLTLHEDQLFASGSQPLLARDTLVVTLHNGAQLMPPHELREILKNTTSNDFSDIHTQMGTGISAEQYPLPNFRAETLSWHFRDSVNSLDFTNKERKSLALDPTLTLSELLDFLQQNVFFGRLSLQDSDRKDIDIQKFGHHTMASRRALRGRPHSLCGK